MTTAVSHPVAGSTLALLVMLVLIGCVEGESTNSESVYFLRHRAAAAAPLGLAEGIVQVRNRCVYLGPNLIIWPEHFSMVTTETATAITGDGFRIAVGDAVAIGGGQYDSVDDLPSDVIGGPELPCSGPYVWVSEVVSVNPN